MCAVVLNNNNNNINDNKKSNQKTTIRKMIYEKWQSKVPCNSWSCCRLSLLSQPQMVSVHTTSQKQQHQVTTNHIPLHMDHLIHPYWLTLQVQCTQECRLAFYCVPIHKYNINHKKLLFTCTTINYVEIKEDILLMVS